MEYSFVFIVLSFFLIHQFSSASQGLVLASSAVHVNKLAPALYVLGDSVVDSGNNNYLETLAKGNYKPYGVDYPNGASGRLTNGYTIVDYVAAWLGLPFVPPYLGLSKVKRSEVTTGINYASGAAGILPESGTATGDNLSLEKQVNYFKQTVQFDLPKSLKTRKNVSTYLAKSIVVVVIGSNDYLNNYLQPTRYNSSKIYTPQQYVFEMGPIGCLPSVVNSVNPRPTTACVEGINFLVKIFNFGVTNMIQELTSTLKGSTFVYGDVFENTYQQAITPHKYGFSGGNAPCCSISNASSLCLPNQTPCKNKNAYHYWDGFHPTQRVNYEIANGCLGGSSTCFPINVYQLFFSFVFTLLILFFLLIQTQEFASIEALKLPLQDHVLAPALYVFGDSLVDSGNNNYLQTLAKVNYTPYGVDFRNGPTGRFNNGKTAGDNLNLEEHVNYFTKTVKIDLPKIFKTHKKISKYLSKLAQDFQTHKKISKYLSKSIFVISIGTNDYINNYLHPAFYNSSRIYNPQQCVDLLVSNLKKHLMSLYKLGARKFVVFELGPVGCTPAFVFRATPKPITPCIEDINNVVKIFVFGVTKMTQELTSTLKGSTLFMLMFSRKAINRTCILIDMYLRFVFRIRPCANRNAHLYWDAFHPVQRVNYEVANGCFKGSTTCYPINIRQLAYL
ncbi:hypothetical protein MKX03_012328 [Papaver bracteatum]|nr:hypothetical protein MKX03_012328 [Papaver bracteatum]